MILYPAIDLKEGACVRLVKGAMDQATLFNDDPADQARVFAGAGAEWLHVVDLDGAQAGRSVNGAAVAAILAAVDIPIQLGGGIRSAADIERWLGLGVARLVLGTAALDNADLVRSACARHPQRIAVAIDARGGRVAVEGWTRTTDATPRALAQRFENAGVAALVYTDIDRDGVLGGVNVEATAAFAERLATPVIASGGVASLDDLHALKAAEGRGIAGVIAGRALYDGRLGLTDALAAVAA